MDPAGEKDPVASATKQFEAAGLPVALGVTPGVQGQTADHEKPPVTSSSGSSIDKKDAKIDIPAADDVQNDPLGHLPPDERLVIERQTVIPDVKVGFFGLYRFATPMDRFWVGVGVSTAIIAGALLPLMTVLFGGLAQAFQDFALGRTDRHGLESEINKYTL